MGKKLLSLTFAILLISIFSIGIIYSEGETGGATGGTGGTAGTGATGTTGGDGKIPVGGDTGKNDITPYLHPQGTKSSDYSQRVYASGQVAASRNADGTSDVKIGSGGSLQFVTSDGKQETALVKGFEGSLKFESGKVSGIDLKNTAGKDNKLEIPMGKNNDLYKFSPSENGKMELKVELRNGEFYQIENKGEGINAKIPLGKDKILNMDVPGDGSKMTHEQGKPWEVIARSNTEGPINIKAPSIENKDGSKIGASSEKLDPVLFRGEGNFIFEYGNGQKMIAQGQGLNKQVALEYNYNENSGKYYPNANSGGKFTIGNDATKPGFEANNVYKERENKPLNIVGDVSEIPKGDNTRSYLVVKQSSGGNSIGIVSSEKEAPGFELSLRGGKSGNSVLPQMERESDFLKIASGGMVDGKSSSVMVTNNKGLLDVSINGNGQATLDDKTLFKSGGEVGLYQGTMYQKDSSGNLKPSSGLTTPDFQIKFGDGNIKVATDEGRIIDTNGKIFGTYDEKAGMTRLAVGSDANVIKALKSGEPLAEEIMDPRLKVNPPNPSPEVVKPATYVAPPPEPPKIQIPQQVASLISSIAPSSLPITVINQDGSKSTHDLFKEVGPKYDPNVHRDLLLKFSRKECGPCRAISGNIESWAEQHGNAKIIPVDTNLPQNQALVQRYGIASLPAMVRVDPKTGNALEVIQGNPQGVMSLLGRLRP